ncbi:MAG: isochorismate synthase [Acidimicrobiia bacterium]
MTHAALRPDVVARTRFLPDDLDPLDALGPDGFAWLHDGVGFVTAGVAARVPVGDVDRVLAGFAVDDAVRGSGTGVIAVGALPFDPRTAGEMVVPAMVVGRTADGKAWITDVESVPPTPIAVSPRPTRFTVRQGMGRDAWDAAVMRVRTEIDRDAVRKVVLARDVHVAADEPFDLPRVVRRLRTEQPGCFVFSVDGLVGASPELLLARAGLDVWSRPLAGTTPRIDDAALAGLAASTKDADEHRFVVDALVEEFRRRCGETVRVAGPEIMRFSTLAHLATTISGRLPAARAESALAFARALHPTPAVGGTPNDAAAALIDELEDGSRGRYAGPVGWVDADGNGEFALALRSAEIDGTDAVLRAGAGIVAGSDPGAEWAETEAKLAPMLSALIRP